ncbi:MAG: hypothetical protein A2W47_04305 [Gammaproteobacteria bacterium RIFCSPHIGHO2_12_38_15]|nr:MAG: hypothetical protein A2W47_04305 [Gammaproteobacteria bacterium RIFCSPHIGHO2_12_38_15]
MHSRETKEKISIALRGNKNGRGNQSIKGRHLSTETKRKISLAHIGRKHPWNNRNFQDGELNPMFGKRGNLSPNWKGGRPHCKKCNKELKNRKSKLCFPCYKKEAIGELSANWKGGIAPVNYKIRQSLEYQIWRKEVYAKDKYKCRLCNKKKQLVAHHIKLFSEFPELRFSVDNGITLCRSHHAKIHKSIKSEIRS